MGAANIVGRTAESAACAAQEAGAIVQKTFDHCGEFMHCFSSTSILVGGRLIDVPKEMIFLGKNTSEQIRTKIVDVSQDVVQVAYSSSDAITKTAQITFRATQEGMAWTSEKASVTYEKTINGGMYVVQTAGDTCTYTCEVIENTEKKTVTIIKKKLDPNGKVIETIKELVPLAAGSGTAAAVGFAIAVGLSGPTFGASLGIAVFAALAASSAGYIATKGTSMAINGQQHSSGEQDLRSAQTAAEYGTGGAYKGYQYSRNNTPPRTAHHSV